MPIRSPKSISPCKRKDKGDKTDFLETGRDKDKEYQKIEKSLIKKIQKIDKKLNNQKIDSQKINNLKIKDKETDKDKDKKFQRIDKERNNLKLSNREL